MKNFKTITPAQYFDQELACTTVCANGINGGELTEQHFLITSNRKKIYLNKKELVKHNLIPDRTPTFIKNWSETDFEKFVEGKLEKVSTEEIFQKMKKKMQQLIVFEDERYFDLIPCWIIGTYFHRLMNAFPYLHFNGNSGCGKTKVISIIAMSAFRGKHSTNTTSAALVRTIHSDHVTCCMDESESLNRTGEDNQTLISMLNSGYKKGSFTEKCEKTKGGKFKIIKLDSYSPKIFAGIKGLDPVLATRCIPIIMPPIEINREILFRDVNVDDSDWPEIRSLLYTLMLTEFQTVRKIYHNLTPPSTNLNPRDWELWKPIFTIGKIVNEETFKSLLKLMEKSQSLKKSTNDDAVFQISFLECLLEMIETQKSEENKYPVAQIKNFLANSDRDEFYWVADKKNNKWIGDQLRRLHIVSRPSDLGRIDGKVQRYFQLDKNLIGKRLKALNH